MWGSDTAGLTSRNLQPSCAWERGHQKPLPPGSPRLLGTALHVNHPRQPSELAASASCHLSGLLNQHEAPVTPVSLPHFAQAPRQPVEAPCHRGLQLPPGPTFRFVPTMQTAATYLNVTMGQARPRPHHTFPPASVSSYSPGDSHGYHSISSSRCGAASEKRSGAGQGHKAGARIPTLHQHPGHTPASTTL